MSAIAPRETLQQIILCFGVKHLNDAADDADFTVLNDFSTSGNMKQQLLETADTWSGYIDRRSR